MSGVLTMKAGAKRPFDAMDVSSSAASPPFGCSPHSASHPFHGSPVPFNSTSLANIQAKRYRTAGNPAAALTTLFPAPGPGAAHDPQAVSDPCNNRRWVTPVRSMLKDAAPKKNPGAGEERSASSEDDSDDGHLVEKGNSPSCAVPGDENDQLARDMAKHFPRNIRRLMASAQREEAAQKKLFTIADVRKVVQLITAEREDQMREEFARTLQDKLSEQFKSFAQFNEDYISRHLKHRDFSYLS